MKYWIVLSFILLVGSSTVTSAEELTLTPTDSMNLLAKNVSDNAIAKYKAEKLQPGDFSITIIDMHDPANLSTGSVNGETGIYPASVVKLFYLGAVHRALEDGKLKDSAELRRGMHDMIVDSVNDATNWILEAVTDAGNGPLLPDDEMQKWAFKRNSINRYYTSLGYKGINTCQKTFIEGPYGRDKIFLGMGAKNRNSLTTNATARLLATIALEKMVTPDRSRQMLELLHRDMSSQSGGSDDQAHGFSAMALPKDAKLWSKAGWTNTARHDAAYIEMPDGRKLISVIFTAGHARQKQILPSMVTDILAGLPAKP